LDGSEKLVASGAPEPRIGMHGATHATQPRSAFIVGDGAEATPVIGHMSTAPWNSEGWLAAALIAMAPPRLSP